MKGKKLIALAVGAVMCGSLVAGLTGCNGDSDSVGSGAPITIWVSETEGVKTLTLEQVKDFFKAHSEYDGKYKVTVEGQTESESATMMTTDVATGADIYCFAQDQLGRLIEANALSKLGTEAAKFVADNNDAGAVKAAKVGADTYCFPITSDNGYFMYYDKSVVKNEHLNDLAAIVKDCKDAGRKFAYELEGSAWYTASFFFATGCHSNWNFDNETKKWVFNDDFNSDKGMIAMKGMQILTKEDSVWVNSSKAAEFGSAGTLEDGTVIGGGAAVVVTGTWDSSTAKENLGANYAVAKLPSFKVGDQTYQLGSYSGNKLMGVKPHTDRDTQVFCLALAQYLSGKECQEARFDLKGWGPSNKDVQALDKVKNDEALSALAAQNEFATPQGTIYGGWWDIAKLLGTGSKNAALNDETALKKALDDYTAACEAFTKLSEEAMNAFGVIGSIASLNDGNVPSTELAEGQAAWSSWGADYKMEKSEKDGKTIWKTVKKVVLAEGDQFKVRQGQSWDNQYAGIGDDGYSITGGTSPNYTITAENAGEFYIVLTIEADGKKGKITLEAE